MVRCEPLALVELPLGQKDTPDQNPPEPGLKPGQIPLFLETILLVVLISPLPLGSWTMTQVGLGTGGGNGGMDYLWCILPRDVRTSTFCQLMGLPYSTTKIEKGKTENNFSQGFADFATKQRHLRLKPPEWTRKLVLAWPFA